MVTKAAETPGAALHHAYQRKENQSRDDCLQAGICFIPLSIEAMGGGLHTKTLETVRTLSRQLSRQTGREESLVMSHMCESLSVTLMKGNSALFTNRSPTFTPSDIDGDLDIT